jgi:trehalose/maltose transport system substrate-binding protein
VRLRNFLALSTLWVLFSGLIAAPAEAVTVTLACGSVGIEFEVCKDSARNWEAKTGNTVKIISTPKDSTSRLALFQQVLSAGSSDIDVLQVDVIWPGILGQHLLDLAPSFSPQALAEFFPATIANNRVGGRLVALPWFMDTGLLYYRKDLLEKYGFTPPATWDELTLIATHIQTAERTGSTGTQLWGLVFQARASESLTCNAMEWLHTMGGGRVVEADGRISVNNPQAQAAVAMVQGWVGTIAPPGVLNYSEEESRGAFQSGRAVFMRNWLYAWPLVNSPGSPVAGKVGLVPLPAGAGGETTGTLGGNHLAVSRYSKHPDAAVDLVRFLTSAEEQKRRSVAASFDPPRPALYADPQVLAASSYLPIARKVYENALPRPSSVTGLKYNQVSYEFWNAIHDVLTGRETPANALASLDTKLQRISRHGRW